MAEALRKGTVPHVANEIFYLLLGAAGLGWFWYFIAGLLRNIEALQSSWVVTAIQGGGVVLFAVVAVRGTREELRQHALAKKSRQANQRVTEALGTLHDRAPDVDAIVQETKADKKQVVRLVEQRKQELLIDDHFLQNELSTLIVDYLQPLPRNAKRVLNRFRVSLLIAYNRGLLTTPPRVTAQQIGKWLVLGERWPQLGRSLSAAPEKMLVLEGQAAVPAQLPSVTPATPAAAATTQPAAPPVDPFMESVKTLAPFYIGDADLRGFIQSPPQLGAVLQRLVEYGDPPTSAAPTASQPTTNLPATKQA